MLTYVVNRSRWPIGETQSTLVDRNAAWIDILQPVSRPDLATAIVDVRPVRAAAS